MTPKVTIYTMPFCFSCLTAKALLDKKGTAYAEIDVSRDPEERRRMAMLAGGRRSVPQIFVGGVHVGGGDELHDLDRRGDLDRLLEDR
jgi:glutaredoxin 3